MKNVLSLFSIIVIFSISSINGVSPDVESFIKCLEVQQEEYLKSKDLKYKTLNRRNLPTTEVIRLKGEFYKEKSEILELASQNQDSSFFSIIKERYKDKYEKRTRSLVGVLGVDPYSSCVTKNPEVQYYFSMISIIKAFKREINGSKPPR